MHALDTYIWPVQASTSRCPVELHAATAREDGSCSNGTAMAPPGGSSAPAGVFLLQEIISARRRRGARPALIEDDLFL
jgi:hypothetical protein